MVRFFYFIIIAINCMACSTSKKVNTSIPEEFPKTWVGNWGGTLNIFSAKGKTQSVPMEVEIKKIDTSATRYIFALIYGEDKVKGRRAYETIIKDPSKGLFINDEKNTIQMEEYFINNKLHCWFEVEGTLLMSIFEKKGEELIFDIISGSATPVSVTGNQKFEGEDIPAVKTFPVKGVQHAVLKRL